ncbi:TPA: hypothetical protein DIT45_00945 [Candidatus Acetothermia bacterium]|nr:hypothetical protein [Candidatus Acetothermia bacterium]
MGKILPRPDLEGALAHKQPCVRTGLFQVVSPDVTDRTTRVVSLKRVVSRVIIRESVCVTVFVHIADPDDVRARLGIEDLDIGPDLVAHITIDIFIRIVDSDPHLIAFL